MDHRSLASDERVEERALAGARLARQDDPGKIHPILAAGLGRDARLNLCTHRPQLRNELGRLDRHDIFLIRKVDARFDERQQARQHIVPIAGPAASGARHQALGGSEFLNTGSGDGHRHTLGLFEIEPAVGVRAGGEFPRLRVADTFEPRHRAHHAINERRPAREHDVEAVLTRVGQRSHRHRDKHGQFDVFT